jgi:flagellar basal body-associated protein FliL
MSDPKAPAKATDAKHDDAAKPASSTPKALLAIVALNFVVSAAVGGFLLLRPPPAPVMATPAPADHGKKEHGGGGEHGTEEKKEEGGGHGEEKKAEGGHGEEKKAEGDSKDAPTGSTARLEDIIVHLRNPEVDRYARLTLDVEMSTPSELTQLQPRTPQIRDAVITALSEETYESLRGAEGLQMMKDKVRARIDDVVPGTVRAVYVSGFIVQ